jgi:hypothetical protein
MRRAQCCVAALHVALHPNAPIFVTSGRTSIQPPQGGARRSLAMIFHNLVARAQSRIAKRRHYNRLANEIQNLTPRDLADLRADRGEMLRHAYQTVYG